MQVSNRALTRITVTLREQTGKQLPEPGESGLVGLIAARVGTSEHATIGVGDDAAAFRWPRGFLLSPAIPDTGG